MNLVVILTLLFSGAYRVRGNLPLCPFTNVATISAPCRFNPGVHNYETLDIRSDVLLETSSSVATHSFNVTGTLTLASSAVVAMRYNEQPNFGAGLGSSGGSYAGRGGAESGRGLDVGQPTPYGSSRNIDKAGSQGGNGGKGGGLLKIQALEVILNGIIRVNGEHGKNDIKSGGGSGGGISVECKTLTGSGSLEARGGFGRNGGGGGSGGRIAVSCKNDNFKGTFQAQGGRTEETIESFGIQTGNLQMTASSTKKVLINTNSYHYYYPTNGRLQSSNAWMPVTSSFGEFLQVNFWQAEYVTGIATQGTGRAKETNYVKTYSFQYLDENNNWKVYMEFGRKKVFHGNEDVSSVVKNLLLFPLLTKSLRIYPESWNGEIALRIELYKNGKTL